MSGRQPDFATTQWGLVITASAEDTAEARTALDALYRTYCDPIYAFIRRRGYDRQDGQDLTQDFFVHLLEKGTLGRADRQRGRFRSFLLGALDHFLAHAEERAASREAEKELILQVLTRTRWNRRRAAQELQISYKALLYKLKQIGCEEYGAS